MLISYCFKQLVIQFKLAEPFSYLTTFPLIKIKSEGILIYPPFLYVVLLILWIGVKLRKHLLTLYHLYLVRKLIICAQNSLTTSFLMDIKTCRNFQSQTKTLEGPKSQCVNWIFHFEVQSFWLDYKNYKASLLIRCCCLASLEILSIIENGILFTVSNFKMVAQWIYDGQSEPSWHLTLSVRPITT